MNLHAPFSISSRLMPALVIGGATISLGNGPRNEDGRTCYVCFIDLPDGSEHKITDLRSGGRRAERFRGAAFLSVRRG